MKRKTMVTGVTGENIMTGQAEVRGFKRMIAVIAVPGLLKNVSFGVFRINLGTADGIDPRGLLGLINENTRNRDIAIGKANILKSYSIFEADSKYSDTLMNALNKASYEGRQIVIEPSNDHISSDRGKGFRSGGGPEYKRKRK